MNFSYYPGCTLKTKAKDLDKYAVESAKALGVTLDEIGEWQCCGGVYPVAKDEIATKLSSVRTLVSARDAGKDLVTVCSACHNVIKRVNYDMQHDENVQLKVNNYAQFETPYHGETNVLHYLEMLRDVVGFDKIKEKVTNPLTGRKIGAYYGCLLLRPSKEMAFDDPENPTIMEDFITALGATPVVYAQRNECCGGYVTVEDKSFATKRCNAVMASAAEYGVEELITACPLCMYNLKENSTDHQLPVHYFTELLAEALGVKE
ncbi:MAG: CoB--CoM heterodisulfide reductase iron-sulfur subunit B family protein [Lachnospira sp.]|nr:CoB--CoM heterodisulfide reductase iron-sulfur subunit B family protein [Lachnospira sp.]